jgi:pimeloyl-ACP methyl ester carboxylesterase
MIGFLLIIAAFNIVAFIGVNVAHNKVFSRADYDEYNTEYFYTYDEIDTNKYKRETLSIKSGENTLAGYLYGKENRKGLIIISPGHRDASDIKLPEITYFVDKGWMVLGYDYTGCYASEGSSMIGYVQAPADLDAVLEYVEKDHRFDKLPVMLFGHSLGAYASAAVLQYKHNITSVVAASGFDDPTEQWEYSVKRFTNVFGKLLSPYSRMLMKTKFGDMAHFSAIDGINSTEIPLLIMQGTTDEFYGKVSSIYEHRDKISNKNCSLRLMNSENHHGHYDYFLSDKAVDYRNKIKNNETDKKEAIDKFLYIEHDDEIMNFINEFYLEALPGV